MLEAKIVKDAHFEEVAEVKMDSKNRVTLGKHKDSIKPSSYKVYRNPIGQIILDPQVSIPAHEAWLFKNPKALASVKRGLKDAAEGKLVDFDPDKD